MKEIKYTIKRTLSEENIKDILTTAIEGGIGYWAILDNGTYDWSRAREAYYERTGERPCYCDIAYDLLSRGKEVIFIDAETEDVKKPQEDEVYRLTMDKLIKGCQTWEQRTGKNLQKAIEDMDYDAEDADIIIQMSIFDGEIIFG